MIQNPILKGFCPDPSIVRAGDDYYIATSTFEWWPGVRLFHSRDLKNWEQIPSPLQRKSQLDMVGNPPSGGIWAPCLSYDGEKFYLVYTDVKNKSGRFYNTHNYVVTTKDIYGEWSEPVYLNSIGFDPSLFHDVDGRKYLVNMVFKFKGIQVQEVDPKTLALMGEPQMVYGGSGLRCTEGPHMYHFGDWYYLIVAEGGTGVEHCVTMARSKSVWGPFETIPDNPILTSDREDPFALQKCGHGDIVETQDGEFYMVHLCARPMGNERWCTLGRETAIQKMEFDQDGWLRLKAGGKYAKMQTEEPGFLSKFQAKGDESGRSQAPCEETAKKICNDTWEENGFHDDFDQRILSVRYDSPRRDHGEFADVKTRPGFVRIRGQEYMNSNHHVSLLAVRQKNVCCNVETCVEFEPESIFQMAGLSYLYDSNNFFILGKTMTDAGETVLTLYHCDNGTDTEDTTPIPVPASESVNLRIQVAENGTIVRFYYRVGEGEWFQIGGEYSTLKLSDEYCRGFTGAQFGLYAHDLVRMEKCADFRYFNVNV